MDYEKEILPSGEAIPIPSSSQSSQVTQDTQSDREIGQYPCKFCFRSYKNQQLLDIHMSKGHDTSKPYFCKLCPKRYEMKKYLIGHVKSQHASAFVCEICSKKCSSRHQLKDHHKRHNKDAQDVSYNCEECGNVYKTPGGRSSHMREHLAVDPYPCLQCKRRFLKKVDLEIHEFSHKGIHPPANFDTAANSPGNIKPFPCDLCEKSFALRENLVSHLEVHLEARTYNCDQCKLIFTTEQRLKQHLLNAHLNYFTCAKCQKQFLRRSQLESHKLKTHDVKGVFNCKSCSSTFTLKSAYSAHKYYMHRPKFTCMHCPRILGSKWELRHHLELHEQLNDFKVKADGATSENLTK